MWLIILQKISTNVALEGNLIRMLSSLKASCGKILEVRYRRLAKVGLLNQEQVNGCKVVSSEQSSATTASHLDVCSGILILR